jgi:hypothetical protein
LKRAGDDLICSTVPEAASTLTRVDGIRKDDTVSRTRSLSSSVEAISSAELAGRSSFFADH